MLKAISPIDGRYATKTGALADYFSEYALIKYRVLVEVRYLVALARLPLPQLSALTEAQQRDVLRLATDFSESDAERIKVIERTTNHDVKAVEYFIKEQLTEQGVDSSVLEFVHFALTSQDINNTAVPYSLKEAVQRVLIPLLEDVHSKIMACADEWKAIPMLARTHGQPASPTLLGKEFRVFGERLGLQLEQLREARYYAKFGGATGNFNAHHVAYPDIDWVAFANRFVTEDLGLLRSQYTTQIAHYDHLAAIFHTMSRINTILIDLCRDVWQYISMEYFKQKTIAGEVGSSAMPHKVNPIDFENAEGNLGIASALLGHLAGKLPISRLQRDLTDSTVLRNVGVPIGHMLIALQAILKGMDKLLLNEAALSADLDTNWAVVAEAIQNILRREGYPKPYEALKALTRGKAQITKSDIQDFIGTLDVSDAIKEELRAITPHNYVGVYGN